MKGEDDRRDLGSDRLARDTEPCLPGDELSSCARCGLPFGHEPNHCGDFRGDGSSDALDRLDSRVECRNREIGNLRALLRGATRKLERVAESLDEVLEVMS